MPMLDDPSMLHGEGSILSTSLNEFGNFNTANRFKDSVDNKVLVQEQSMDQSRFGQKIKVNRLLGSVNQTTPSLITPQINNNTSVSVMRDGERIIDSVMSQSSMPGISSSNLYNRINKDDIQRIEKFDSLSKAIALRKLI